MKSVSYFKKLLVITLISSTGLLIPILSFAQVPANDDCAGALSLTSGLQVCTAGTSSLTAQTVAKSTLSAGIPNPTCGGTVKYDVWYSFTATTATPTIKLSNLGANFTSPGIQILTGTCGSLVNVTCATGTTLTAINLIGGQKYYIRVYSTTFGGIPTTSAGFDICITDPIASIIDYSKSYINVSKGNNGGTIDPGDTLEMRLTFVIKKLTADSLSFLDTLFHNRGLAYVPNSMIMRTNEGIAYLSYTDVTTDAGDAGYITSNAALDTFIHMNFGIGSNRSTRGKLRNTSRPSVFTTTCIIMATYRVVVYAGYNSKVNFKTGALTYKDSVSATLFNVQFPDDSFIVYKSPGLCPNAISVSNAIGAEFNGTFGAPATGGAAPILRNRGTSAYTNYQYWPFGSAGGPQDYYYGITNTTATTWTAATYANLQKLAKPDGTHARVFDEWDNIGDHTGQTTGKGNPPCDTTKAQNNATNPCGYMLVINSAYRADTAFTYTVTNLCESTNYEISAWFRNICYKCGCDSFGTGSTSASYKQSFVGTNDTSGVMPNIAFDINGTDYYTTGNLKYIGLGTPPTGTDTVNKWVKRGFTYTTAPGQTSFTMTLRNNAPGGGGNDWALDDISVFTCLPNMIYSPSVNPSICQGNYIQVNDTIRSYFNNWVQYKWQKSTDGGTTFNDIIGSSGTGSPSLVGSNYQYVSTYTIPYSTTADNGTKFRVIVATNPTNITDPNCNVTDGTSIITLTVIDCGIPLATELLNFNGKLINGYGNLYWSTSHEEDNVVFEIQKSFDGINFKKIKNVNGKGVSSTNYYNLMDSVPISSDVWYRVILINKKGDAKSSHIIQLSNQTQFFDVTNVVNPFSGRLMFDVTLTQDGKVDASILTLNGNLVRQQSFNGYNGVNSYYFQNLDALAPGVYVLQVRNKDKTISKKIVRQ
jgi:hypothetical protein